MQKLALALAAATAAYVGSEPDGVCADPGLCIEKTVLLQKSGMSIQITPTATADADQIAHEGQLLDSWTQCNDDRHTANNMGAVEASKCFDSEGERELNQANAKAFLGFVRADEVVGAFADLAIENHNSQFMNCHEFGHVAAQCQFHLAKKDRLDNTNRIMAAVLSGHEEARRARMSAAILSQARHHDSEVQMARTQKSIYKMQENVHALRRDVTRLAHRVSAVERTLLSEEFIGFSIKIMECLKSIGAAEEDYMIALDSFWQALAEDARRMSFSPRTGQYDQIHDEFRKGTQKAWHRARDAVSSISVTLEESDFLTKHFEFVFATVLREFTPNRECIRILTDRGTLRERFMELLDHDTFLPSLKSGLITAQDLFLANAVVSGLGAMIQDDYQESLGAIEVAIEHMVDTMGHNGEFEDKLLTSWLPLLCPLNPTCQNAASKNVTVNLETAVQVTADLIVVDPFQKRVFYNCMGLPMTGIATASNTGIYENGTLGGSACPRKKYKDKKCSEQVNKWLDHGVAESWKRHCLDHGYDGSWSIEKEKVRYDSLSGDPANASYMGDGFVAYSHICPMDKMKLIRADQDAQEESCCSISSEKCAFSDDEEGFTSKVESQLRVRTAAFDLTAFDLEINQAQTHWLWKSPTSTQENLTQNLTQFVEAQQYPSECCNKSKTIRLECPEDMVFEWMEKNSMVVEVIMQCDLDRTEATKLNRLQQQENASAFSEMWFFYELEWKIKYDGVEESYDDQKHPLCARRGTQADNYALKQIYEPPPESRGQDVPEPPESRGQDVPEHLKVLEGLWAFWRKFQNIRDGPIFGSHGDMDDSTGNLLSSDNSARNILSRINAWYPVIQEPSCAKACQQQGFTSMSDPSCSFCLWGGVAGPNDNKEFSTRSQEDLNRTGQVQLEPNTDFLVELEMLRNVKTRESSEDLRFIESAVVSTSPDIAAAAATAAAGVSVGDFEDLGKCKGKGDSGCSFFRCKHRRVFINSGTTGIVYYEVIFSDTINPLDRKTPCRCRGRWNWGPMKIDECFQPGQWDDCCPSEGELACVECQPVVAAGRLSFTKVNMR